MENPKIRFKGYTKDWEQRKLGEVFKEYSEKNHTELPALTIIQGGGTVKREDSDRNLMYDESNLSNYKMVRKDDFIVHLRSFEGGLEKSALDGIVSPAYHTFHSDVADSRFYYPYFRSHEFIKHKLVPHVYGIRDGRSIDIDGMKIIEIPYTSMEEQRQIGDYLESLDHLITLHQRKCEQTKKLKKYMLQKMFPQNGAKVPEIRFDGFTYDWEQRKLSELLEKYEDPVETPHDGYERVGIRSHAKGTFHSFVEPGKELDTAKMYRVAADKFILNITFAWEHAVAITDNNDAGKLVSHRFPQFSFNPKLKPHFFKYLMLDKKFREHLELSSPGGAGRNRVLKISDMLKYEIKLPSIEEQIKIGEYFDSLDHLITLHQRKCDELKKMKKYMLQNMFI